MEMCAWIHGCVGSDHAVEQSSQCCEAHLPLAADGYEGGSYIQWGLGLQLFLFLEVLWLT